MNPAGTADTVSPPDERAFRSVLSHLASGVVAVAGTDLAGGPVGLTVSSFVSVSLNPPLVSFCAARSSTTWPVLRAGGRVCVTILGEDQNGAATQLSVRDPDRFRGIDWEPSPGGLPVLFGGLAWLECTIQAEYRAGDHDIVVCLVDRLGLADPAGPLVRFRGEYARVVGTGS
jgi:flavin reductase (DIM6/NTAB) family NADH-FMN oxidoreductase RutF